MNSPPKPDPQLAAELFALIERDQGYAYISDGIGTMSRAEIIDHARASMIAHQQCAILLRGFINRFS